MNCLQSVIFFLVILFGVANAHAQVEKSDSLSGTDLPAIAGKYLIGAEGMPDEASPPLPPVVLYDGFGTVPFATRYELARLTGKTFTPGQIARWSGGAVGGSLSTQWMPGLMTAETGRLAVSQTVGALTLEAFASASHYGSMLGLTRQLGFGGSLTYRFSPKLALTLYGARYSTTGPVTNAMAGFMDVTSFGGYLDYRFADRWGVKAGAQSYHSMLDGHWHTSPSVVPYYHTSSGADIGIDVGSILYNLILDKAFPDSRLRGPRNPSAEIPKIGILPVGEAPPPPPGAR